MASRLPDDYFRQPLGESDDIDGDATGNPSERTRLPWRGPRRLTGGAEGFAVRTVVVVGMMALVGGYALGNAIWFNAGDVPPIVSAAPSAVVTASGSAEVSVTESDADADVTVAYTGQVVGKRALSAIPLCEDGVNPRALIDDDPQSVWRCPGDGLGETVQFTIDASQPVVGVRLINGNVTEEGSYNAERRILTVGWTMTRDGSRFEQGLGGNDPAPQEVRFPPTTTGGMLLTILDSTGPGEASEDANAVSVAGVEFLYAADE